jgi:hypothetical protein
VRDRQTFWDQETARETTETTTATIRNFRSKRKRRRKQGILGRTSRLVFREKERARTTTTTTTTTITKRREKKVHGQDRQKHPPHRGRNDHTKDLEPTQKKIKTTQNFKKIKIKNNNQRLKTNK